MSKPPMYLSDDTAEIPNEAMSENNENAGSPDGNVNPEQEEQVGQSASIHLSNHTKDGYFTAFKRFLNATFRFRKTSLTFFVLITYIVVGVLSYLSKYNALRLPSKEPTILTSSWLDLQFISQYPHSYGSHFNDEVHDYILQRVELLAQNKKYISYEDDAKTGLNAFYLQKELWNLSKSSPNDLQYFESSNIVVKIEGTDPQLPGVLLSAHFDSVPTAYGTTDDGAGVASLLGILEHYATSGKQPLRTLVFNFNNNEEFGLYGAVAFLSHPWFKLVNYFINLEGTGTGERAILFRTTDYGVAKMYNSVRSPFGTSIFQQGFASGLVHSETDYKVYFDAGLRGVDIAFYKPRSLYHTAMDQIKTSSKNALWHMLSNSLDYVENIANSKSVEETDEQAVYFDLLGLYFIVLPLSQLFTLDLLLLIGVPVILIVLGALISKKCSWSIGYSLWRLPIFASIAFVATNFVNQIIYYFNPLFVSRNFHVPLITLSATFIFVNYLLLTFTQYLWPIKDLKLVLSLDVYLLLWGLLVYVTIKEGEPSSIITGGYLITILYTLYSVSIIFGLISVLVSSPKKVRLNTYQRIEENIDENGDPIDENAPLLGVSAASNQPNLKTNDDIYNSTGYDWSLQYLILVPVNLLISYISIELLLEGLNQTVQESLKSTNFLSFVLLCSSILISLPILSFSYKLNSFFATLLIGIILIGSGISLVSDPFTSTSPLKIRFLQTIDLDSNSIKPIVTSYSREGLIKPVLKDLPSIKSSNVSISCDPVSDGMESCKYESIRPYLIDGTAKENEFDSYLKITKVKAVDENRSPYTPFFAKISIDAVDNRFCSLVFNSTYSKRSPVKFITYYHDETSNKTSSVLNGGSTSLPSGASKDANGNEVFKWLDGIDSVKLHKLNWNQTSYHVGIQWIPKWLEDGDGDEPIDSPQNKLGVSVSCFWGEYDSVAIVDGESHRKIPALDELLKYSPNYISWSNLNEGLVKVDKYLEI